jgi:RNA polymerase sigma-70 factor (ECF subfamily)
MRGETEIGGAARSFPPTRCSLIERLGAPEAEARRAATAQWIDLYWKPVYAYFRRRWGKDNEAAKDLTQAFFAASIERDFFAGFDPSRARFRAFLRTCLDRFASNDARAAAAAKRGGAVEHVALDFEDAERSLARRPAPEVEVESSVEAWFEAEWRRALLEAALDDLRRECAARGNALRFEIFRRYDVDDAPGARPTYAELARELGVDEAAVNNALHAARHDFRRLVLDRLRAWTRDEAEFEDELRALLGDAAGER